MMSPSFGYGGYGPMYGMSTGLSFSLTYGNAWSPYGGYGMYNPYYGYGNPYYGGYGNPYYGNYYDNSPRVVNYGKRPSRHSAVVQPTQRTRTRDTGNNNIASVNSSNKMRQRQVQDEYYVRPSRRTSGLTIDNFTQRNSGNTGNSLFTTPSSQSTRTRDSYNSDNAGRTSSYTPSSSPSPSRGSSGGSSGGSSSPRPRGRN